VLVTVLVASGCASSTAPSPASAAAASRGAPVGSGVHSGVHGPGVRGGGGASSDLPGSPPPSGSAGSPGAGRPLVPLAVVTGFANYRVDSVTTAGLAAQLRAGTLLVPCGAQAAVAAALGVSAGGAGGVGSAGSGSASGVGGVGSAGSGGAGGVPPGCLAADAVPSHLPASSRALALLPPGLVTAALRVVPIGNADLFGETPARTTPYPLAVPAPVGWPTAWTTYDPNAVRVVLTTGVNCPDRGVSYQTNVLGKGWDWLLRAGTARYTGRHWDKRFGWWVVDAVRTDHAGAVWRLIRNADVAVSDFECSMTRRFVQHDSGTLFSIDPRVAPLMAKAGFDVATIAADHNTNPGLGAIGETVDLFRANGIAPVGGGRTLAEALRPAVLDVHGVRFGFVGFDAIGGSAYATADSPGVAPLTAATARTAIAAARKAGAQVVFALPQWSSVEYRAAFTGFQRSLIAELEAAGADEIIGADFHWAGAISITPGGRAGDRFVTASQGNFWFGQNWSRQTEEGVMTMLTFVGTRLAQVRLIPTVVLDDAQPNLIDPATDGQYVLQQVLAVSRLLEP
jgi:poly-gamma-glutamate capsule biosynthesis protein CapA/YwtB (metallophosphatase superfamily)